MRRTPLGGNGSWIAQTELQPQIKKTKDNRLPPPHTLIMDFTMSHVKIRDYRNVYLNRPDPIDFIPLTVDTTGLLYDDFIRLLFLHVHREVSTLANDLPEESDQFRFLRLCVSLI